MITSLVEIQNFSQNLMGRHVILLGYAFWLKRSGNGSIKKYCLFCTTFNHLTSTKAMYINATPFYDIIFGKSKIILYAKHFDVEMFKRKWENTLHAVVLPVNGTRLSAAIVQDL